MWEASVAASDAADNLTGLVGDGRAGHRRLGLMVVWLVVRSIRRSRAGR